MGYGDEILAAGQAQRLYDADGSRVLIVDIARKPRWHPIWEGNPVIVRPSELESLGGNYRVLQNAGHCRPYILYPFTVDTGWRFNKAFRARDNIAKIYLTDVELQLGYDLQAQYGPYFVVEPFTKHDNLRWPIEHWRILTRALRREFPEITLIQHVHPDTPEILPAVRPAQATFRDACGIVNRAALYIRSESGMCHAAAALGVYQVTIWGGCMDWNVLGGYPKQLGILDESLGSPCGCWRACNHCHQILQSITPEAVVEAVRQQLEVQTLEGMVVN